MNNAGSQTEEGHNHFEGMTVPVAIWGGGGLIHRCVILLLCNATYMHTKSSPIVFEKQPMVHKNVIHTLKATSIMVYCITIKPLTFDPPMSNLVDPNITISTKI